MRELRDSSIKIFRYLPELDIFSITEEYKEISSQLQITEWNPVVWIGRFFSLDNDYGEHWFDNWDERNELAEKIAEKHNLPPKCKDYTEILVRWHEKVSSAMKEHYDIDGPEQALIISPSRFTPRFNDAYHTDEQRKMFWTDACKSLHLSLETMFEEAENSYALHKRLKEEHNYPFEEFDLEKEMNEIGQKYSNAGQKKEGIKIFEYYPGTKGWHTFTLTEEYKKIAGKLNLYEDKCPVRWIGRYFTLDQDYGKLWFENWSSRETFREENKREYYPINPDRFIDGDDGPCHASGHRELFWRDVLKSLRFSKEMLIEEARLKYAAEQGLFDEGRLPQELHSLYFPEGFDLERNISELR